MDKERLDSVSGANLDFCWTLVGLASLEGRVKDRRRPGPGAEADGISLDVLDEGREDMASPKVSSPRSCW